MLIHTLPPRLMWRVIAIRADSIWRFVTYDASVAWMPKSPKASLVPPLAAPVRFGWCCLRCLTLRGINIRSALPIGCGDGHGRRLSGCGCLGRRSGAPVGARRPLGGPTGATRRTVAARGTAVAARSTGAGSSLRLALGTRAGDLTLVDP